MACWQREATGLTPDQIGERLAEEHTEPRQAEREEAGHPDLQDGLGGDPLFFPRARCAEWQRLHELATISGLAFYEPRLDPQVTTWTVQQREREQQAGAVEEAARVGRAARAGAAGRRIRGWARRYSLTLADVVHQLVQRAAGGVEGGLMVGEFTPVPGAAPRVRPRGEAARSLPASSGPWLDRSGFAGSGEDYLGPALDW